jgi:hypothetical protein
MRAARELTSAIVTSGAQALDQGAPVDRIQQEFVAPAVDLLADAESRAVLAAGADSAALEAIEHVVIALEGLRAQLESKGWERPSDS